MTDFCKGCAHYADEECIILVFSTYGRIPENRITKCPCDVCLIKVVCEKRCIDFTKFSGNIIRKYGRWL